jgi:hypothetical protein
MEIQIESRNYQLSIQLKLFLIVFGYMKHIRESNDISNNGYLSCELYDGGAFTPIANCTESTVTGYSEGNHELNFTVIRPWDAESK